MKFEEWQARSLKCAYRVKDFPHAFCEHGKVPWNCHPDRCPLLAKWEQELEDSSKESK